MTSQALQDIKGGLVVSCQAYPGEPMRDTRVMTAVAMAAVQGGAAAIRAQGVSDLLAIRAAVAVPVIGLIKDGTDGVFITPTLAHCKAVAGTGADIVAFDGTTRARPDGSTLHDCIQEIHRHGALAMADCGSLSDAEASINAGVDCLSTTLAGYTDERDRTEGPDFDLLNQLVSASPVPVFAEGRIRIPEEAVQALAHGAYAVVVGTAITHPTTLTRLFKSAIEATRTTPRTL